LLGEIKERKIKIMLKNKITITFVMSIAMLMLLAAFTATIVKAEGTPQILTDKPDYSPGETVIIYGTGFAPGVPITVNVTRPNGHVDSSLNKGINIVYNVTIIYREDGTSDEDGNFTATYQLDGIFGEYTVIATDGTGNTATTTFTDRWWSVSVSPSSATVTQGDSTSATVSAEAHDPAGGPDISLSAIGQPVGVTVSFSPASGAPDFDSTMTVSVGLAVTPNTYPITIRAMVGGAVKDTTTFTLTVTVPTYSVTFDATSTSPLPDVASGTTIVTGTIAGTPFTVANSELPKTFTGIVSGTSITYSYNSPLPSTIPGKQYRWLSTSGTESASEQTTQSGSFSLTSTSTVTATYKTQYEVTFTQSGLGSDALDTVVTIDVDNDGTDDYTKDYTGLGASGFGFWVDSGTDIKYTYTNPVPSSLPSTQYWLQSITGPASVVTVTSKTDITGNYVKLPFSAVTTSSLCPFDRDPVTDDQEFNLLFTRDPADISKYRLTASNPGQFYYNVFYIGDPGDEVSLTIRIPYPFVTQGAVPIHVYSQVDIVGQCFSPSGQLSGFTISGTETITPSGAYGISLEDYENDYVEITVSGAVPDSGLVYVTIHLDFGLKKQSGYTTDGNNAATNTVDAGYTIPNLDEYVFTYYIGLTEQPNPPTINNINIFKNDPGFFGIVTIDGEPVEGATITIRDSAGNIIGTATTDENGYYFFYYKHKGKEAQFTVTLTSPMENSQIVSLKSNKFIEASFQL
jgi:hypothetical protein